MSKSISQGLCFYVLILKRKLVYGIFSVTLNTNWWFAKTLEHFNRILE